jgi:1,4-alpha-glucan branching enzyme
MAVLDVVKKKSGSIIGPQQMTEATHEVELTFHAPEAKTVCIAGKFNAWDTGSTPMKKGKDGIWRIKLTLPPGKYEYKYFVDGAWASDLKCPELVPNPFGTNNCVISVH